ncbi:MAG: penicillin-binding transpeptidase domain-containing protein [Lachnospiraceae bacterium]|nr:penicillin-binding transpeptidase domain-containing protein [Lachnospiraceae bacterium]
MFAHIIYFNLRLNVDILNSPYNTRQNLKAEHVIRGKIVSSDGATLAETLTDDEGNEYRNYPFANVFAHAVGFSTHGKSGIELASNYELMTSHVNIVDQVINEFRNKKSRGDTVVTTLDAGIQESAYSALRDYRGAVIVMEPGTGAIKAMVSKPDFDPNTIASVWDEMVSDKTSSQLVNRATQGLYPPGSVFKIITSLAYYRTHGSMDGFSYNCMGEMTVDEYTVHCYNGTVHGEEDLSSAFAHSCNTAFSQIGLDLGAETLTRTAETLLFGEKLPIDLYSSMSRWSLGADDGDVMLVQTAFGQGKTLVTPYHMALLVSAIANDGVLMKPYLVDSVKTAAGDVISKTKTEAYRTLFTPAEAEELTGLMVKVVEEGSASDITYTGIPAAGKTGSAEYLKSDGSIGTHSWFVGFMHPDDPDLVIAVLAEDGGAGSSTAVPIAQSIIENYYYG